MDTDLAYYRRRAAEEKAAAAAAPHSRVRSIHVELARRYDERIRAIEVEPPQVGADLVSAA
jgi:hypothetical protein